MGIIFFFAGGKAVCGSKFLILSTHPTLRNKLKLLMFGPFQYAFFKISLGLAGLFLIPDGIFDPSDVSKGL